MTTTRRFLAASGLALALAALAWWASTGGAVDDGDRALRESGSPSTEDPATALRGTTATGGRQDVEIRTGAGKGDPPSADAPSLEGVLAAPAWVQDGATVSLVVEGVDRASAALQRPADVLGDGVRWHARGLPPGRHRVTATATLDDRTAWGRTAPIELDEGDVRAGLVLRMREYALEGRVEVGDTGAPLADFTVEVRWSFRADGPEVRMSSAADSEVIAPAVAAWSDRIEAPLSFGSGPGTSNDAPEPAFERPRERFATTTDALGNYRVALPGPGTCMVGGQAQDDAANAPWFGRLTSVFSVDAREPTARHTLRLRPYGHLRAQVTGTDARTEVTLRRVGSHGRRAHVVLPGGRLNDLELDAGRWAAFARSEDGLVGRASIDVQHRHVARPTIALVAPSTLEGVVVGPDGAPAPGARVTARDAEADAEEHVVTADDRGRFRIEGLPGAGYVVTGALGDARAAPVEADVPAGGAIVDAGTLRLAPASPDGTTGRRD